MTLDDVIRLAKEAGLPHGYETQEPMWMDRLEAFAKLVAEHERVRMCEQYRKVCNEDTKKNEANN